MPTASTEPLIVAYIQTSGQISYENLPGCGKRGVGNKKSAQQELGRFVLKNGSSRRVEIRNDSVDHGLRRGIDDLVH